MKWLIIFFNLAVVAALIVLRQYAYNYHRLSLESVRSS